MAKHTNSPGAEKAVQASPTGHGLLFPPTTDEQVYRCLEWDGPPISLEEMDEGITAEILERHGRGA